jgi:hypothetical protein
MGDGQFIFERWFNSRWHIRRPGFGQPFFCGMLLSRSGPIKFEDELDDDEKCGSCLRNATRSTPPEGQG